MLVEKFLDLPDAYILCGFWLCFGGCIVFFMQLDAPFWLVVCAAMLALPWLVALCIAGLYGIACVLLALD